jgi:hypothetical protein
MAMIIYKYSPFFLMICKNENKFCNNLHQTMCDIIHDKKPDVGYLRKIDEQFSGTGQT